MAEFTQNNFPTELTLADTDVTVKSITAIDDVPVTFQDTITRLNIVGDIPPNADNVLQELHRVNPNVVNHVLLSNTSATSPMELTLGNPGNGDEYAVGKRIIFIGQGLPTFHHDNKDDISLMLRLPGSNDGLTVYGDTGYDGNAVGGFLYVTGSNPVFEIEVLDWGSIDRTTLLFKKYN